MLEELSLVPVVLVVPVVPVVPVVVFFFVEESPPTIPPSTRTGVNDVAIWSRNSFWMVSFAPVMTMVIFTPSEDCVFENVKVKIGVASPPGLRNPKS